MPPNMGFVVTLARFSGSTTWKIEINGQLPLCPNEPWVEGVSGSNPTLNPPKIVPPGGTLTIACLASVPHCGELGGYFISAADLGR